MCPSFLKGLPEHSEASQRQPHRGYTTIHRGDDAGSDHGDGVPPDPYRHPPVRMR